MKSYMTSLLKSNTYIPIYSGLFKIFFFFYYSIINKSSDSYVNDLKFIDYIHLLYLKNVSAILYYFLSLTFSRNFPNTLLIDNFIKSDSKSFRALFLISVIFYTYILKKSDYLYYITLWIFLQIKPYFKYIYRFLMLVTYFSLSL